MMKREIIVCSLIVTFAMKGLSNFQSDKEKAAREVVESFCNDEFNADSSGKRQNLIKFTPEREKLEKKRTGPALPWALFWDWDAYLVISSYKVVQVSVNGDSGVATVEYQCLGRSEGKERFVPLEESTETVRLHLVYNGKKWWVLDPPIPKISKKKLIEAYEYEFQEINNDEWIRKATKQQMEYYDRKKQALESLKAMPK